MLQVVDVDVCEPYGAGASSPGQSGSMTLDANGGAQALQKFKRQKKNHPNL